MKAGESGRRPELDGIRAFAVLAVFMVHTGYLNDVGPAFLGVNVFFTLSGFLITTLLLQERERRGAVDYRAFYMRRILRLYPALIAACGLIAIFAVIDPFESAAVVARGFAFALSYISDFTFGLQQDWTAHTWSLAVEEQFYLVWPVTLMFLFRHGNLRRSVLILTAMLALVASLSALAFGGSTAHYSPLGTAFQLIAGAALAVAPIRVPRGTWISIIAAYLLVHFASPNPVERALEYGPMQIFTVASVLLIAWALQYSPRVFTNRPVVWLGKRSYGFYLYHRPVLILTGYEIHTRSVQTAVALLASLLITAASYSLIEQPFLRRKKSYARMPEPVVAAA